MAKVIVITGGQRSGKSSFAQQLALQHNPNPTYLATARRWDSEFDQRIQRHIADRGPQWVNIEEEKLIASHNFLGQTVLLDCVTLWLANFFHDSGFNADVSLKQAIEEWDRFVQHNCTIIAVTNEIGMGVIPDNATTRAFADLQGWINQHIAKQAQQVYLMVSGIPVTIKST